MITYMAINTSNGKFYIGSTKKIDERKADHLRNKQNYPFQNALRKNPEKFIWEVWEDDSEEPTLEQALLDRWFGKEQCYNLNPSSSRPPSWEGRQHEEETIFKMRRSAKARWETESPERREEYAERMRNSNPNQDPEVRAKISAGRKGKATGDLNPSKRPEVRDKISKAKKGLPNPSLKERNLTNNPAKRKDVREKMSSSVRGKKWWVNKEGLSKQQKDCPGPEWQNGRKWRGENAS